MRTSLFALGFFLVARAFSQSLRNDTTVEPITATTRTESPTAEVSQQEEETSTAESSPEITGTRAPFSPAIMETATALVVSTSLTSSEELSTTSAPAIDSSPYPGPDLEEQSSEPESQQPPATALPVIFSTQVVVESGELPPSVGTTQIFSNTTSTPAPAPSPATVTATIGDSLITVVPSAPSIVFTPPEATIPVTVFPDSPGVTLSGNTIVSVSVVDPDASTVTAVLVISSLDAASAQVVTISVPPTPTPPSEESPYSIPIVISRPSFVVVGDASLSPGGPGATINGVPVSLGTDTSVLVVASTTITIAETATGVGGFVYTGLSSASAANGTVNGTARASNFPPQNNDALKRIIPLGTGALSLLLAFFWSLSFVREI